MPCKSTNRNSVMLALLLLACASTNSVYIGEQRRELSQGATGESRDRGVSIGRSKQQESLSEETAISTSHRREPFHRILVLCQDDTECERKSFCHGGEGHKSCLPCRRSRRRCQRNGMCCHGNICRQGRCVPREMHYDTSYAKTSQSDSDEDSISQHTRDNMRKLREDEPCENSDQCGSNLCCAQHFWTRICKPILVEGDICTKKRDRHSDIFQRCHCGNSLSCKRHPSPDLRYHTCQFIKGKRIGTKIESIVKENAEVVIPVDRDGQEPTLQIDLQLTDDGHTWNQAVAPGHEQDTDGEARMDYASEDQSVSENRWKEEATNEAVYQHTDNTTHYARATQSHAESGKEFRTPETL